MKAGGGMRSDAAGALAQGRRTETDVSHGGGLGLSAWYIFSEDERTGGTNGLLSSDRDRVPNDSQGWGSYLSVGPPVHESSAEKRFKIIPRTAPTSHKGQ